MVHGGLFATKAEVDAKAGENVDVTGWTEANINAWCLQAESYINITSRYDWSALFSAPATTTLNATVWHLLGEIESNLVAIYGIQYNMAGFTTILEAEDMINLLWARLQSGIRLLQDQKVVDFINGA